MFYRIASARRLSALARTAITCGVLAAAGGLVTAGGSAHATTVTCPTVSATGAVTPAPSPGVYWWGCDLAGADLAGADLANANLAWGDLAGANLTGANLAGASLQGTNFTGGADLASANLTGTNLTETNFTGASLQGASLSGAYLDLTTLASANLTDLNAGDADFLESVLTGANVSGAKLADATLTRPQTCGVTGTPASLPAHWNPVGGCLVGPYADLSNGDLSGADLSGQDLFNAMLQHTNLSGANLTDANLDQAYLISVNLDDATISGANLGSTYAFRQVASQSVTASPTTTLPKNYTLDDGYLMGPDADLAGASLSGLDLAGIDLNGATLTNANVAGAALRGATLTEALTGGLTGQPASLPAGLSIVSGYLVGPSTNFGGQDLSGVDFAGLNLTDALFQLTQLNGADLAGTTLTNADFFAADLTSANLSDAVAGGADFNAANLKSADLSGADLSTAQLTNVRSGSIASGPAKLPANWQLVDGYLVGPEADLAGISLPGANLAGADLLVADLDGAYLSGADLDGANLEEAYLSAANLTNADLDSANLTAATLQGATITGATFTGATWANTTCADGTNSNKHLDGCPGPLDTTPPVVTVTGVANGKVYVTGAVPKAGCATTDNGTVATPATLTITTTGKNGFGRFTATCAGAVDLAGNTQKAPVSVSYTTVAGLHGYISPAARSTVARSVKTMTIRFRLTTSSGAAITASAGKALGAARDVRVSLRGPDIKVVTVACGWNATQKDFTCAIRIPSGVRTGTAQDYTLTAGENVGTGWLNVPALRGTSNPEVIHFR
jgi:uncharacterized protein YjbI with pentapeptide repeats